MCAQTDRYIDRHTYILRDTQIDKQTDIQTDSQSLYDYIAKTHDVGYWGFVRANFNARIPLDDNDD